MLSKKKIILITTLSFIPAVSFADYSSYGCQKKEAALQKQLDYAQQYKNVHRAEALKRAIQDVRTKCGSTPDYTVQDLQLDDNVYKDILDTKIAKYKSKVADAEKELAKAKIKGKPKKIAQKEAKLTERKSELEYYLKERATLNKE